MNTTGKGFVEFWDWAISKGLMKKNTAKALATASKQVLGIDEDWETKDVSNLNADDIVNRFTNLRSVDVKPENLNAYGRRFKKALELFMQYWHDPSSWKPSSQTSSNLKLKSTKLDRTKGSQVSHNANEIVVPDTGPFTSLGLVEYPYPLRDNCIVCLKLPSDLKIADVERLAAFMQTLALDFTPSRIS